MMELIIIPLLVFFSVLIFLLPKEFYMKTRNAISEFVDIRKDDRVQSRGQASRNTVVEKIMTLSRRFYFVLPRPLRLVRKTYVESMVRITGLNQGTGVEEITGLRYLLLLFSILYSLFLYVLTNEGLIIPFMGLLGFICFYVPEKFLEIRAKRRMGSIQKSVPSMLTSAAILLEAGMNIPQVLDVISEVTNNDFSKMMRLVLNDSKMGIPLEKSLENTLNTCYLEEYRSFVSVIIQGLGYGSSGLPQLMRRLAYESWDARKRTAQNLAQKASMKLFLPLVFLVLPAFLIFLMGPLMFYIKEIF